MTSPLENLLWEKIRRAGAIPFSRFMEVALYHPQHGYYMREGEHPAGRAGDFVTAPEMSSAFGGLIAEFLRAGGCGLEAGGWDVWEFGAGRGKLARDIMAALPEASRPSRYVLVERHPSAREAVVFANFEFLVFNFELGENLDFQKLETQNSKLKTRSERALVLANEFLDAFPADVFRRAETGWEMLGVALDGENFAESWTRTEDASALAYLEKYASHAERGQRVEMAHGVGAWLDAVAGLAPAETSGLVFDYGGAADEVYALARKFGTLKCHYRHTVDGKPFERAGGKDITASVNFSFLEDEARARGFEAKTVELSAFLVQAGAEKFLTDESFAGAERQGLLQMLDPTGMGGLFKVCFLAKGRELPAMKTWRELVGVELPSS